MTMRIRVGLSVVAGLLLTSTGLAAPHRSAIRDPVDQKATFDHDPMSVTTYDASASVPVILPTRRQILALLHHPNRRLAEAIADSLPINQTQIGAPTQIVVRTATVTGDTQDYKARLRFYYQFDNDIRFKDKLKAIGSDTDHPTDGDYRVTTESPAKVENGLAGFTVIFYGSALQGQPYQKLYIVASILQKDPTTGKYTKETGQYCFQTLTIYDPALASPAQRVAPVHRKGRHIRTKRKN